MGQILSDYIKAAGGPRLTFLVWDSFIGESPAVNFSSLNFCILRVVINRAIAIQVFQIAYVVITAIILVKERRGHLRDKPTMKAR
jgi:hypothetical protein